MSTLIKAFSDSNAHTDGAWCVKAIRAPTIEVDGTKEHVFVSGGLDGVVRHWVLKEAVVKDELTSGTAKQMHAISLYYKEHGQGILALDIARDRSVIVSSSMDGTMVIRRDFANKFQEFDAATLELNACDAYQISLSPNAKLVATASAEGKILLWDVSTGVLKDSYLGIEKEKRLEGRMTMDLKFSSDGKRIACGTSDGACHILDTETGKILGSMKAHASMIRAICWMSSEGGDDKLASGANDSLVCLYDLRAMNVATSWRAYPSGAVFGLDFDSAISDYLATAGGGGMVTLWDSRSSSSDTGSFVPVSSIQAHNGEAWDVSFLDGGMKLASVGDDGALAVFSCPARSI